MACSRGKANPSALTERKLFALSAGLCQNPACLVNLFQEIGQKTIHIAEMAHILGASDTGPRSDPSNTKIDRGDYRNLILLCPTCHTKVDKAEDEFPDHLLRGWKEGHAQKIALAFGLQAFPSRQEARKAIEPLLRENSHVFSEYGPLTDERFNPESGSPEIWRRKILTILLPNNRKILQILNSNENHLSKSEMTLLTKFRDHVDDFEAKHISLSDASGTQFPTELEKILS